MSCHLVIHRQIYAYAAVDYVDTRISNYAIEYLRENENIRDYFWACSLGTKKEYFKQQKMGLELSWYCPFKRVKDHTVEHCQK